MLLSLIAVINSLFDITTLFCMNDVLYYLTFFSIGELIRRFCGTTVFEKTFPKTIALLMMVPLIATWILLLIANIPHVQIVVALIGIMVFYLLSQVSAFNCLFNPFGKFSLQLYLLNGFFLVVSRTVIVSKLGVTNPFLVVGFNVFVDFFISYLFIRFFCNRIKPIKY